LKPEPQFEHIIESLSEGLIVMDGNLCVTVFNQGAEKITAMPRSLALGNSIGAVLDRDPWIAATAVKSMEEKKVFAEHEGRLHRRLGTTIPVVATFSPLYNRYGDIDGTVLLLKEVWGARLLEIDSIRRDRLALIGTFAAGIAHEVKNPLGGIKGAAQLLERRLGAKDLTEYTDVITRETDRLSGILDEVLNFATPRKPRQDRLNIHQVLDRARALLPLPEGTELKLEYDPSIPAVIGDGEQLVQVFINLIKNAIEALSQEGEVRIMTRMATDFHLAEPGLKGNKVVLVKVKDNGCGIAPEDLDKLFTPFFTTKPKGTGLGIAIAYTIVKEHGGLFSVESSPGEGTEVSVFLPADEEQSYE